jgi:hypothetical protein
MTRQANTRRVIVLPVYTVGVALLTVLLFCGVTLGAAVRISNGNAKDLIDRYEADKQQTAAANKGFYCALFGSQLAAFEDATSPAGRQSYQAWLDIYRLAKCQPVR